MTKYLVLIGDGMADRPLKQLKGKTPLEAADTPNLDFIASQGFSGLVNNVPPGLEPGSDVAAMSIFGYNPKEYYTGRGPLEAASLGVKLYPGDIAFRCNLVTINKGKMADFTAGHISTAEARQIFKKLNKELGDEKTEFLPGLSYRNLLIFRGADPALARLRTVPPHDITGRKISPYLPKGAGAERLLQLMNEAEVLLHQQKSRATLIWPWGQGRTPGLTPFKKKFGKKAAVITAVHLIKGLGKTLGMTVINVPGATGYLDTNYQGKADYAWRALKKHDLVIVHVEAPDEAGHEGNIKHKIQAIEDFDRQVVGRLLNKVKGAKGEKIKILVLPDHPTPISLKTHSREDVPFAIYPAAPRVKKMVKGYSERQAKVSGFRLKNGDQLLERIFKGEL